MNFINGLSKTAWVLLAACLLIIVAVDVQVADDHLPQELDLDISRSSAASQWQVYFDTGSGYTETESVTRPLAAGTEVQHLVFPLPSQPVKGFRLDPLMTEGTVVIAAARVTDRVMDQPSYRGRRPGLPLDLRRITPQHEIARLTLQPNGGGLEIVTVPGSTDSQCLLALDQPLAGGRQGPWNFFLAVLPLDVSLLFIYVLAFTMFWIAIGKSPVAWWHDRAPRSSGPRGKRYPVIASASALLAFYVWLILLNLGRSPLEPGQEPSWVAVMTYAIAHRWQLGREIILTYGPAMPLTMCSYNGSIETEVFVGRLIIKVWSMVLLIWVGGRLHPARRAVFWVVAVALLGEFSEQAFWCVSVMAVGLLFARGKRSDRWLLAPTLVYLTTVALIKVTFLMYSVLMLGVVAADRAWQRKWFAAVAPALGFILCFGLEWRLFGDALSNVPIYLKGSLEMVNGFSQAMSEPPDPVILGLGLASAALAVLQIIFLSLRSWYPRWTSLPMLAFLTGGLLLGWKQGFVRADSHVIDWFVYVVVGAAAAPAFFPPDPGMGRRWADRACFALILIAGVAGLARLNPDTGTQITLMFRDRWRSALQVVLHPQQFARAAKEAVVQNRAAYALPQIRSIVGQSPVDVFCDEQAIAILNGLNYRPRPSFLNYSTYTPWLMNFNVAFYCSPQSPVYVLFKLESIDNRLPTLQNGSLLVLLAEYYEQVLTEKGFVLFHRREQPQVSGTPADFPLLSQGDFALTDSLPLPVNTPLWCQLELHETLVGKLLRTFYQQPPLDVEVTYSGGRMSTYRLLPNLASSGFLIDPLPASTDEFLGWMAGRPSESVRSIRLKESVPITRIFAPHAHYKFSQVPEPHALTSNVRPAAGSQLPGG